MARLLRPEGYGLYALAFSVASVSSVFIGGGLIDAIAPALSRAWSRGDGDELRGTVGFYLRFVAACAGVTVVFIAFLPWITAHLYHNGTVGGYAAVIVVASMVSVSVFALVQLLLQVAGRIRTLALLTLSDVVVRYAAMVALVIAGLGVWGAVFGHLVGAIIIGALAATLYISVERAHAIAPRFGQFYMLARHASWQPLLKPTLWVLADSNFALLYGALPIAMVGLYTVGAELAYFKLALGYLMLAMSAMGPVSIVMNVHFPTVQTTRPDTLRSTFVRVTGVAVLLSAGITTVVLLLAPVVFRLLYGTVYLPAVPYVYGLGVFGALFGLGIGLGPMWRALNRVRVSIVINLCVLGVGIPSGLWMIHAWHIWGAVAMVTLWYTVSHAVSFVWLLRELGRSDTLVRRNEL